VSGPARLRGLLEEAAAAGVFPSAWAVVLRDGRPAFEGGAGGATARTVFDLASLTKPLATATVFLTLWRDGALDPRTPVHRVRPDAAAGRHGATLGDLLAHRAGLPAFVPFFAPVLRASPALLAPGCPPALRGAARAEVAAAALAVLPGAAPGAAAVYGDVAPIVLGELLAAVAGAPLDVLFAERVAAPLGVGARFHRLSAGIVPSADVAPTGRMRPREPAPGQEGLWDGLPSAPSRPGEVDDDNAWAMDGVAGHAGLFGTAADVAALGQAVLADWAGAGRLAPRACWAAALGRDAETPGSTRALGFDTRVPGDAAGPRSAGRLLGDRTPGAVGHTGFTGTSLWIDLGRRLVVALCTNRTAGPRGRADVRIQDFRPRFHDAAVEAL
jgi:CubicO group peptidase (beta-lactamase class C family)